MAASRLVVIDSFATPNLVENCRFFLKPIRWEDDRYRLPEDFRRCVAKEPLGGPVPRQDDAIQILSDDRIVG